MAEFDKFLGFLFFLGMAIAGFWGIKYLAGIIPLWLQGWFSMKAKERKNGDISENSRPIITEQDGVEVLFRK